MKGIFIGLGSNLNAPATQIKTAIRALDSLNAVQVWRQSSLYRSPPMGPQDQPDYVNAVVEVETDLSAPALLGVLQQIEQQQGRVRHRHWGERTIDLDILLYGAQQWDEPNLLIPHPGLAERAFVLYPLAEIAPDLVVPGLGTIQSLVARCPQNRLVRLESQ